MTSKLVLMLLFVALPLAANAAEYKIHKGSQYALCRDLLPVLHTLNQRPPVCGIRFSAKFKQFATPDWKPMDPSKHLGLLKQAYVVDRIGVSGHTPEQSAREWGKQKSKTLRKIADGKILLQTALFDLDNDGSAEAVLKRIRFGHCPSKSAAKNQTQPTIYVISPDGKTLNRDYSQYTSYPAYIFFYQHRIFFPTGAPSH